MTEPVRPGPLDPAATQARVRRSRTQLLGGRGSGASPTEIDSRTRGRRELAGEPTPQYLANFARQTAIVRGDGAAIALDIAATREQLAVGLHAIRARLSPSVIARRQLWAATRAIRRAVRAAERNPIPAGVALTVALLLLRRRQGRRGPSASQRPAAGIGGPACAVGEQRVFAQHLRRKPPRGVTGHYADLPAAVVPAQIQMGVVAGARSEAPSECRWHSTMA